jgi:GT2 family glycosyltransferase
VSVTNEPRITTILPTFRRPALLKRAVLSALNQSFPDFTVQILDNASDDETEDVARHLMRQDSRIRYSRQPQNIGAVANIISGIEGVQTRYFNILCDDDALMPRFFATTMRIHEARGTQPAFVSTRVVVLDENGGLSTPFPHPNERCQMSPPDGVARCIKIGVSLSGVMYRTSAIREIGTPRLAWWNWTESGWHALAAIAAPIEFAPEVGSIMYNHSAGGSKQMDGMEFRISWFKMLADVRAAAARSGVSDATWRRLIGAHVGATFASSCVRICGTRDGSSDAELQQLAVRSGLNGALVASAVRLAGAIRAIGAGGMVNGAIDWMLKTRDARERGTGSRVGSDPDLASASDVIVNLNSQAGVASYRAT